jgi:hypothetical protein
MQLSPSGRWTQNGASPPFPPRSGQWILRAVATTEVGVRQVRGAGLQKKPDRPRTRDFLGLAGNLDEKSGHAHPLRVRSSQ